jgi:hypothetical protein
MFAAVAPFAGSGASPAQIDRVKDLPIWAFHSKYDKKPPPDGVRATIAALEAAGASAALTEVETADHDCWSVGFDDYHLLEWLLAQRRGQEATWPPGTVPWKLRLADAAAGWQWWQAVLQVGIPLALVAAVWHALRTRRRAARSEATDRQGS